MNVWIAHITQVYHGILQIGRNSIFLDRARSIQKKHGFKKVVYLEEHEDLEVARIRERQIKGWSQAKKRKLISGEWKKDW